MANNNVNNKIKELEVEKDTISSTLEELKNSFDEGELDEEEYEASKLDFETKSRSVESQLNELKGTEETGGTSEEGKEDKPVDYSKLPWVDLRKIAVEKGITLGKGITREIVIENLNQIKSKTEKPLEDYEEQPLRIDIDPHVIAQIEILKGEIPSLDSTMSALNMKRQVAESSLNILKKNRSDGLIDEATFSNLKEKYGSEIKPTNEKIEEITKEISLRKSAVSKFDKLSTVNFEHKKILKKMDGELDNIQRGLDFMETARLYIISYLKKYLSEVSFKLNDLEDEEVAKGISYPDEDFLKNKKLGIKNTRDAVTELKTKLDNFETLISSLEKEKDEGDIEKETYSVLRAEYTKEKNRKEKRLGQLQGRLKMMQTEMKSFEKLDESVNSCKSLIDMMEDSFKRIYLEDNIKIKRKKIKSKATEIEKQKKEMNEALLNLEKGVKTALRL